MNTHEPENPIPGSTYENSDAVTIVSPAECAQLRPLEQIAALTGTDSDFNPNIVTIGSLDKM